MPRRNLLISTLALFGSWLMGIPFGKSLPNKEPGNPVLSVLSLAGLIVLVILCARTYGGSPRVRARDCMIGFTVIAIASMILFPVFASAHMAASIGASRQAAKNLG